jgi:thiamine-phosphate pyrophosphorylase
MHKPIASLHYLTQDMPQRSHEEQVRLACVAGVKWIQLRVKNHSFADWLMIAIRVKEITDRFDVTLIINDSVEIAKAVDAAGVHLGQEDFSPTGARKILGAEKIIGYSTHSFHELFAAKNLDVDYFGLGPFRFTLTKDKLNPALGMEGISEIIQQARGRAISKPIIAIGGIQLNDVTELLEAGIDGIAVSSAINLADAPAGMMAQFQKELQRFASAQRDQALSIKQ